MDKVVKELKKQEHNKKDRGRSNNNKKNTEGNRETVAETTVIHRGRAIPVN